LTWQCSGCLRRTNAMNQAVIIDAVRTPRGVARDWGALKDVKAIELLRPLYHALQSRNNLDKAQIEEVVLGCVTQTGEQGANIARISCLYAGWPETIAGETVNSFCTSALVAVSNAAARIMTGSADVLVAGGVESMSRVPMMSDKGAWYSDPAVSKRTRFIPLGIAADLIANLEGFSRAQLDAYALQSHQRAATARAAGRFSSSLVPVCDAGDKPLLEQDEAIREDISIEKLERLESAFAGVGEKGANKLALKHYPQLDDLKNLHTAGNSPAMVDGAALVLIANSDKAASSGCRPRAKILAMANAAVEPLIMLTAGSVATEKALSQTDLSIEDIDLFECNEGFAAVPLKYMRDLNIPDERVNVNGGAIAMGHPMGASGAILLGTLLDELERRDRQFGMVALCGGAGLGTAMLIERM